MLPGIEAESIDEPIIREALTNKTPGPSMPLLRVTQFLGSNHKVRKQVVLEHFSPNLDFQVHNSTINNLSRGLVERVLFKRSKVTGKLCHPTLPKSPEIFYENTESAYLELAALLPTVAPLQHDEFVRLYNGRKRVEYERAAESLLTESLRKRDSRVKVFVKAEKHCVSKKSRENIIPRIIQPRDKRYNVELGRFIKPMEHRIYKAINRMFGDTTVMKGLNAEQTAKAIKWKWDETPNALGIGLDLEKMDLHVSVLALELEHRVYMRCCPKKYKRKLRKLLSWQLQTHGLAYTSDGRLKYVKDGGRCSGDMNTGLGNVILMCLLVYAYNQKFENVGTNIHPRVQTIKLANNGDDCMVILNKNLAHGYMGEIRPWFVEMGFPLTVEDPVAEFEQIEFCQTNPVFDGDKYIMVRHPASIAKDCLSTVYNGTMQTLYDYYHVLSIAGIHLTGGIPIWQEFYAALARGSVLGRHTIMAQHETGMMLMAKGVNRVYKPVQEHARYSFWLAFGITPDEQIAMEKHYSTLEIGWNDMKQTTSRDFIANFPLPPPKFIEVQNTEQVVLKYATKQ